MKPTSKPGAQPKQAEPKPGVEPGDELYVHHAGQPCTGRVVCHGQHGVTVDIDGKHHPVKWDRVLGHKRRVALNGKIIDQGEDGMLLEDQRGRRRYVATPNESKEDPLVIAKAFNDPRRPVLLFKAMPAPSAGRPGLTKKPLTDKNGVQTTRWVSTDMKGPPAQPGQHVGFVNGEHKGHGQVKASGGAGVTVHDTAGGEHRIPHSKITHHWEGEGEPDHSPHEAAATGGKPELAVDNTEAQDPEAISRALFNTSEVDSLPAKAFQPVKSWKELEAKGKEGLGEFTKMLGGVAEKLQLQTGKRPQTLDVAQNNENDAAKKEGRQAKALNKEEFMLPEHWEDEHGYLFMGPLKGEKRATEKVKADYKGDWSQVRDMVRATIAVPSLTQVPGVLQAVKDSGLELAQKPKNNLVKPLPGGYRDLNLIVKLPNGMLAELQVHVKPMTRAKELGHHPYETTRSIEAKYKEVGHGDNPAAWSKEDRETHAKAMAEQEKLYGSAWEKAAGGDKASRQSDGKPGGSSSNLTKSLTGPMMVLLKRGSK